MPILVRPLLDASDHPVLWAAAGIALLALWMFAVRGFLATVSDVAAAIAAWRKAPPDRKTMTIAQVKADSDYLAADTRQRAGLGLLDPATELVHESRFQGHCAAVARGIVGEDRCRQWPYRHINLEEAAEDLRASYRPVRLGPATYWYRSRTP